MSTRLLTGANGGDTTVQWSDDSFGGAKVTALTISGLDGSITFGLPNSSGTVPITIDALGTVKIAGTTALGGTVTSGTLFASVAVTASGTSSFDLSGGSGIFKTPTGAGTLSGTTNIAANKNLTCSAGTTAVDLSLGTGAFKTPTGLFTFGGATASTASAAAITDPGNAGAISVATDGVCNLTTAGAETRTLAIPAFIGQRLTLCLDTKVGNCVVTVASAYDTTPHTIVTMSAAGQYVDFVGCTIAGTRAWRLVANGGTALS